MINNANCVDIAGLRKEAVSYFRNIFQEEIKPRPRFENLEFKRLLPSHISLLTDPFTHKEIDMAVASCEGNKAPGPDGFNFNFVKSSWEVIKHDIYDIVQKFWATSKLPKGSNTAFIALIPKIDSPASFKDFRPISMVGCVYKIISKLLARRLQQVMDYLVDPLQSSFIEGRQILDGALIAGEIIESCKRYKTKATLLKLDFHKAFDSISWGFLDWVQEQMGFPPLWRAWIKSCVMSASASILINGSPTPPIKLHRGLRQGDPLSPFLFNLAAETLNLILKKGMDLHLWDGIATRPNGITISHLQYADDTIIFCPPDIEFLCNIKRSLIAFHIASGLNVNFHKSALYGINVDEAWLLNTADILLCRTGVLPFTYLGLPIGGNSSRINTWEPIITRMNNKLATWKGHMLSIGGRLTLLKASLSSLPLYYMSLFPVPKGIIDIMVKIQRNFLWSGSGLSRAFPLVAWTRIELPKILGGLGVGNLAHRNLALMFKWLWRYFHEPSALWRAVISDKYGYPSSLTFMDLSIPPSGGPWKQICKAVLTHPIAKTFGSQNIRKNVGCGNQTLFWHEIWVSDSPLKILFPRLFSNCVNPSATVSSLGVWDGLEWHWLIPWCRVLGPRAQEEKAALMEILKTVVLDLSRDDSLIWTPHKSGSFSVRSASLELAKSSKCIHQDIVKGIWRGLVPHRIEIFVWLSIQEKINTRSKLAKIGIISHENSSCGLCASYLETPSHLLIHCHTSWKIWNWWLSLWDLSWVFPFSLKDLFQQWRVNGGDNFFKKVWHASFFVILWSLWKERNARIFTTTSSSLCDLKNLILLRMVWWLKAWEDDFPYSATEVLQNPKCLRWLKTAPILNPACLASDEVWSPPPCGSLKWNVDASFNPRFKHAAVGGVLRNDQGNFVCLFSSPIPLLEINSAEVFAIYRAIQISVSSVATKGQPLIIISDSANAVQWCNSDVGGPWNLNFLLNFIRNARKSWLPLSIIHKGRATNGVADALAKQGLSRKDEFLAWC